MKKYKTNILSVTAIVLLVIMLSACNGEKATDTSSTTSIDKTTTTTTIADEIVTAECGGIEVDIPDGFQESNAEGTKEMVEGMGFEDFKSYATSEEEGIKTINLSYTHTCVVWRRYGRNRDKNWRDNRGRTSSKGFKYGKGVDHFA